MEIPNETSTGSDARRPLSPGDAGSQSLAERRREYCHHCGEALQPGSTSCSRCGNQVFQQKFLGELLLEEGVITREKLSEALRLQKRRLGQILVDIGACQPEDLDRALTLQRMGRTRADVYARYLKVAFVLVVALSGALAATWFKFDRSNQFLKRMRQRELSVAEVSDVLSGSSSYSKIEALRSLAGHLNDPGALAVVARALRHEDWDVKLYGIALARKARSPSLVPDLMAIMSLDPDLVAPLAQDVSRAIAESRPGSIAAPFGVQPARTSTPR